MNVIFALGMLLRLLLAPVTMVTQGNEPQKRVREILASLNRKEHRVVERHGVKVEKYREIRSEPVVKSDIKEYAGTYVATDIDYSITVRFESDGAIAAEGFETSAAAGGQARRFTLRDGKIQGALLTGLKVYDDGSNQTFEGVFINRTEFQKLGDKGVSTFGIGVAGQSAVINGVKRERIFFRRQQ